MKSSSTLRYLLPLLLAWSTLGLAQTADSAAPATTAAASTSKNAPKPHKKGFLTPVNQAPPASAKEVPKSVSQSMKSVFDKADTDKATNTTTTAVPGSFTAVRPNSTRCPSASPDNTACSAVDGILTANENRRMDNNDTHPDPALQRVYGAGGSPGSSNGVIAKMRHARPEQGTIAPRRFLLGTGARGVALNRRGNPASVCKCPTVNRQRNGRAGFGIV